MQCSPSLQPGWVAAEFNVCHAAPSPTLRHAIQRQITSYWSRLSYPVEPASLDLSLAEM
ncbi:hypothetical protein BDW60DRAFT_185972 [Aspergillus nidulans var. acristatus]